jgi:hypothetical protein
MGTVGTIDLPNGNLSGLIIAGDLNDATVGSARNITVDGNAGTISAGKTVSKVVIGGNVDQVSGLVVTGVTVNGDAGTISAARTISNVSITGSALDISSAGNVSNVKVGGSVGAAVTGGSVTLGTVFSKAYIQNVFASSTGKQSANGDTTYYGGISANVANRISVGGQISDLTIGRYSQASTEFLNKVIGDGIVSINAHKVYIVTDGELTSTPENS